MPSKFGTHFCLCPMKVLNESLSSAVPSSAVAGESLVPLGLPPLLSAPLPPLSPSHNRQFGRLMSPVYELRPSDTFCLSAQLKVVKGAFGVLANALRRCPFFRPFPMLSASPRRSLPPRRPFRGRPAPSVAVPQIASTRLATRRVGPSVLSVAPASAHSRIPSPHNYTNYN